MLKKLFLPLLLSIPFAACAKGIYPKITEIDPPPQIVEPVVGLVDPNSVKEIEVEEKSWKCPGCNDNEKYVQNNSKQEQRSLIGMPLQQFLETLSRNLISLPIFVREVLEFLTIVAIAVVMGSFSGPLQTAIWG